MKKQEWMGFSAQMGGLAPDKNKASSSVIGAWMAENMSKDHADGLVER